MERLELGADRASLLDIADFESDYIGHPCWNTNTCTVCKSCHVWFDPETQKTKQPFWNPVSSKRIYSNHHKDRPLHSSGIECKDDCSHVWKCRYIKGHEEDFLKVLKSTKQAASKEKTVEVTKKDSKRRLQAREIGIKKGDITSFHH